MVSPVSSAAMMSVGFWPAGKLAMAVNEASPFPCRMVTVPAAVPLATARSGMPSPLNRPAATATGDGPAG